MAEDVLYEGDRACDREAAAAYLRKLADRLAAGEQVLPAERGAPLEAPEDVALRLRATDGDTVRVDVGLEWEPRESATSRGEDTSAETGDDGEDSDDDPRQATGWASAGASGGYPLPRVESLDDADSEFERAAYFLRKGKQDAAVSRFVDAVEGVEDARRQYQVATVCWQLDRTERAATRFETAANLAPEDATIQLEYASFLWSQGRTDAARERYERLLDIAPENPDAHSAIGRFRWETEGDIEAAVDHLERALSMDDDHGLAHCNYAVLLRHGNRHEHAEDHFERALELRGEDPIVQTEYGHFLWEQGEIEEAAKHYAKAESRN